MTMYKINNDIRPNEIRTFFNERDARAFLVSEGCTNGYTGWSRPLRDGESRRVSNAVTEGRAFYTVRNVHGHVVTI